LITVAVNASDLDNWLNQQPTQAAGGKAIPHCPTASRDVPSWGATSCRLPTRAIEG
jgi:hypothetical protein